MNRSPKHRVVSLLSLVLLAFNLVSGAVLAGPIHLTDDNICSQAGLLSQQVDQSSPTRPARGPQLCVFCLPLLHGGIDHSGLPPALDHPMLLVGVADLGGDPQNCSWRLADFAAQAPRAPPALFV